MMPIRGGKMKLVDRIEEFLIAASLLVMVLINFGNVLSRYVLHASWSFSEELMVFLFVYNSFFAAALACRKKAHLGFTMLTDVIGGTPKKVLAVISTFISLALMVLLAVYGTKMVLGQMEYNQRTPALGLPEAFAGMAVPLGSLLVAFRILEAGIKEFLSDRTPLSHSVKGIDP
jgi:TRAP-type C4-dicarboxylate transport system permease small subunit